MLLVSPEYETLEAMTLEVTYRWHSKPTYIRTNTAHLASVLDGSDRFVDERSKKTITDSS
jgi:hypothetical protein